VVVVGVAYLLWHGAMKMTLGTTKYICDPCSPTPFSCNHCTLLPPSVYNTTAYLPPIGPPLSASNNLLVDGRDVDPYFLII
jgi:hypothetical protein